MPEQEVFATKANKATIWARIEPTLHDIVLDGVEATKENFLRRLGIIIEEILSRPDTGEAVEDVEKQEKMNSALWGFAYDLQHSELNITDGDGTKMNLEAIQRAKEIIAGIFGLKLRDIQ